MKLILVNIHPSFTLFKVCGSPHEDDWPAITSGFTRGIYKLFYIHLNFLNQSVSKSKTSFTIRWCCLLCLIIFDLTLRTHIEFIINLYRISAKNVCGCNFTLKKSELKNFAFTFLYGVIEKLKFFV